MNSLDIKRLASKTVALGVLLAVSISGSMVALASAGKPVGEILVNGTSPVEGGAVTVNGEAVKTGRTIFGSSVVTTPEGMSALLNLGKAGRVQLAPGTTFTVDVNGSAITGDLTAGTITVLSAAQSVGVKTLTGDTVMLGAGETAAANSRTAARQSTGPGGLDWWVWAAIVGGAVAAVVIIVALNDDDDNVTSPVR